MISLALLGYPVAHSASPAIYEAALAALALPGRYLLWPTPPGALPQVVQALRDRGFTGANVTLPHKETALSLADDAEENARRAGAANVLYRRGDLLVAANTDGAGLLRSLVERRGDLSGARIAWIGAGGATRTAASALVDAGASLTLISRAEAKAAVLAASLGGHTAPLRRAALPGLFASCDILIQATPATMQGEEAARALLAELPLPSLRPGALVCDLVYRPRRTALLTAAEACGLQTLDGTGMLLYQAAGAFQRFTGREAPIEAMRTALTRELGG
jgi:shikimate dehydrogenase